MATGTSPRVAIIGAGASGICMARHLLEAGTDVTIFEKGSYIGGLWVYENDSGVSPAYRTLHINSPRSLTHFPDFDFEPGTQLFPSHEDMRKYLNQYADHFKVTPRIRFNCPVVALTPKFRPGIDAPKWEIKLENGQTEIFDHVVCASGHLTRPKHAPELRDAFAGEYLHSFDYREPADYARKRVCVVGVGNSAMDIASDVCVGSPRTVLVARTGVLVVPKLLMGICVTDIFVFMYKPWIPAILRKWVVQFLTWVAHGPMHKYGFKPLTKATHGTTSAVICTHIAYDRITVKQGIERIEGKRIYFVDGTSEEFDTLIAATGYLVDFPYLSQDIVPVGENNKIDLYKRMYAPGWPGLWFIGMVNTTTALNHIFNNQAKWLKEFILGHAQLPDDAEMRADIERKRQFIFSKYINTSRHELEEEHGTYFAELRQTIKEGKKRAASNRARSGSVPALDQRKAG